MKNIRFTSYETDFKALLIFVCFGISAFVGYLLPIPSIYFHGIFQKEYQTHFFGTVISVIAAFLVWCAFRLIKPTSWGQKSLAVRKWNIAEFIVVPCLWLLLIIVLGTWFHHMQQTDIEIFPQTVETF